MGELVAVVREDKNGKRTTRWVKDSTVPSAPAKGIPRPAMAKPVESKTPLLKEALSGSRSDHYDRINPQAKVLLEKALESAQAKDGRSMLPNLISYMAGASALNGGDADLNNLAAFYQSLNDNSEYAPFIRGLSSARGKWGSNEFRGIKDYLKEASPQALAKAQAWVYAASHLGDEWIEMLGGGEQRPTEPDYEYDEYGDLIEVDDDNYYDDDNDSYEPEYISFHNEALERLILDHPEHVERIVDEVVNSGIKDVSLLRDRVLHPQQALRDGLL